MTAKGKNQTKNKKTKFKFHLFAVEFFPNWPLLVESYKEYKPGVPFTLLVA